jgi:hypothetical protein
VATTDLSTEYRQLTFELSQAANVEEKCRSLLDALDDRRRGLDAMPVSDAEHQAVSSIWRTAHGWLQDVGKRVRANREAAMRRFEEKDFD